MEKILKIDEHIGATFAGLFSECPVLVDKARPGSADQPILYDEVIDVEVLTKKVSEVNQSTLSTRACAPSRLAYGRGHRQVRSPGYS
jgi:proteasome alpha subunit